MIALSVIICAHNPRMDYLSRVLQSLREQTLPLQQWELLLIDNASTDPLSGAVDLTWQPNARHVREMSLGLASSRLRGVMEATAELIVFVDDDTVLKDDYLAQALNIASEDPHLGAWSGRVRLEFEQSAAEWTKPYWYLLSYRDVLKDARSRSRLFDDATPWGGGMCVRRELAVLYREKWLKSPLRQFFGRRGQMLCACEDTDLALMVCDMGMEVGIFARLELTHLIPPHRATEKYLLRLCRGLEMSCWLLRLQRGVPLRRPPQGFKWWTKFLYDSMRKRSRARRFYMAEVLGKRDAWLAFAALRGGEAGYLHLQEPSGKPDSETNSTAVLKR